MVADLAPHLRAGMAAAALRAQDSAILAEAVVAATRQLAGVIMLEQSRPAQDAADAAVAFCLHGIGAMNDLAATITKGG
jgi:hypothetical protein